MRCDGEPDAGDEARPLRADVQSPGQDDEPDIADGEDEAPPEPLGDPSRHLEHVREREEGTHGEEVPVRLVLQLTRAAHGVPEVQGPAEELQRVDDEVELRIGDLLARVRVQGDGNEQPTHDGVTQPPHPSGGIDAGHTGREAGTACAAREPTSPGPTVEAT